MDNSQIPQVLPLRHLEACAGYGGISLGLHRVVRNLRTVAYCEVEAYACANLVAKMEAGLLDSAPVWTDLKTFPFADFHGCVDIFSAGFPCQPFSCAGKGAADSDPRHLFPYIKRGLELMRPRIVFLENVEGLISAKLKGDGWSDPAGTPVLLHVLRELERVGYRATAGVFSASEVRAPHQRKRVFILGVANDYRSNIEFRSETERLAQSDWASGEVDNAAGARCNASGQRAGSEQQSGERVPGSGCDELAHHHQGLEGRLGGGVQECSGKRTAGAVCGAVANAPLVAEREPEHQARAVARCYTWEDFSGRFGSFPPGPADLDRWREILEADPTLEPALCSVAYGRPSRVDELRLAGNGVVPATAAKAFVILWNELQK